MINWRTLAYGLGLSLNDIVMFPIVNKIVTGWPFYWILIPILGYAIEPILFFYALKNENMTIMNFVRNLISIVAVSLIGLLLFKDVITITKAFGIVLSFVSLFLLTYERLEEKSHLLI